MAKEQKNKTMDLTLSKEQLGSILRAIAPFGTDEYIKLSVIKDNIVIETDELGITGKITIGCPDIKDEYVGESVFINKDLISKLYQNVDGLCTLQLHHDGESWTDTSFIIQGTTINAGLPIFDKEINTGYTPKGNTESVLSEIVEKAIKLTNSAMIKSVAVMGSLNLAKDFVTGTEVTQAIFSNFLKEKELYLSPIFKPFLLNLAKIAGTIKIQETEEGEVVFIAENVEYKVYKIDAVETDIEAFTSNEMCSFRCSGETLSANLARLSIPLFGADANMHITIDEKSKKAKLEVLDIQNRASTSEIDLAAVKGSGLAQLSIDRLSSVLSSFKDCNITFYSDEDDKDTVVAIKVEGDEHKIYLMANI